MALVLAVLSVVVVSGFIGVVLFLRAARFNRDGDADQGRCVPAVVHPQARVISYDDLFI